MNRIYHSLCCVCIITGWMDQTMELGSVDWVLVRIIANPIGESMQVQKFLVG